MGVEPLFTDVEDTPMFHTQVAQLEADLKLLKDRCNTFFSGASKYRDAIAMMHSSGQVFGAALQEFCGAADEESLLLGGGFGSKFAASFRSLSSATEILHMEVDAWLCDPGQGRWLDVSLARIREQQKIFEKKSCEYEAAHMRHLALKKAAKKEVVEKSQQEVNSARTYAEESRFELAKSLNQVHWRKRYEFLEVLVNSMHSHVKFFEMGHEVFREMAPVISQAREVIQQQREQEQQLVAAMNEVVEKHREAAAQRSLQAECMEAEEDGQSGPLQMTASRASKAQSIDGQIRTSLEGGKVAVVKQGYLLKRSHANRNDWKRRFFVLDTRGDLYYYSHKDASVLSSLFHEGVGRKQSVVSLLTTTVKMDDEEGAMRHAFRLVSPQGQFTLQAESEYERMDWVDAVQAVINVLLNTDIPIEKLLQQQQERGHSPSPEAASRHGRHRRRSSNCSASDAAETPPSASPAKDHSGRGSRPLLADQNPLMRLSRVSHMDRDAALAAALAATAPPPALEQLRRLAGNTCCCDCGAPDPDWASLNLGVMVCIECSGTHRQLGVHVSKVRSCTLDVKVWEPLIMDIFAAIGNRFSNEVWEARLQHQQRTKLHAESWVWADDSDEDESNGSATPSTSSVARVLGSDLLYTNLHEPTPDVGKPQPCSSAADRQQFITEKYVNRVFALHLPQEAAQELLWAAVQEGDIRLVLRALAAGADVNLPHQGNRAHMAVMHTHSTCLQAIRATPEELHDLSATAASSPANATALHCACVSGQPTMVEFLLLNNASWDVADCFHRTPLHWCIVFDSAEAAKLLLKRGAKRDARDALGLTVMDLVLRKGRMADEELFLLLS